MNYLKNFNHDLPKEHFSKGGNAVTNLHPRSKPLYEAAIAKHPELDLFVSDEPMSGVTGYLSLRFKQNRSEDLSSFWKTFWEIKKELNIEL